MKSRKIGKLKESWKTEDSLKNNLNGWQIEYYGNAGHSTKSGCLPLRFVSIGHLQGIFICM